jgi:Sugar (and other) transporter
MAFSINLDVTISLGKDNQWAWRIPIVIMQVFPLILMSIICRLPETPRWFFSMHRKESAKRALKVMHWGGGGKIQIRGTRQGPARGKRREDWLFGYAHTRRSSVPPQHRNNYEPSESSPNWLWR